MCPPGCIITVITVITVIITVINPVVISNVDIAVITVIGDGSFEFLGCSENVRQLAPELPVHADGRSRWKSKI